MPLTARTIQSPSVKLDVLLTVHNTASPSEKVKFTLPPPPLMYLMKLKFLLKQLPPGKMLTLRYFDFTEFYTVIRYITFLRKF